MQKRILVADATPVRLFMAMDNHLAGTAGRARTNRKAELPGLDHDVSPPYRSDVMNGIDIDRIKRKTLRRPVPGFRNQARDLVIHAKDEPGSDAEARVRHDAGIMPRQPDAPTIDAGFDAGEEREDRLDDIIPEKVAA